MIDKVLFVGATPPGCIQRLQSAGVHAFAVPNVDAVSAAVQEHGLQLDNLLLMGGKAQGALSWEDVANKEAEPSCDAIMQAIVQHNRCCVLDTAAANPAATTSTAAAGEQLSTQHRDCDQHQQQRQLPTPPPVLVVGYVMKASREEQLASAGLLHLLPIDGVCFMPIDVGRLSDAQQQQGHIDVLLHKGSDELVPAPDGSVAWSQRVADLQAWLASRPHICVVDPLPNTAKVLDRGVLGQLVDQLQQLQLPGGVAARAPRYCQVDSFAAADMQHQLAAKGLAAPFIVKPVVACGVKHSHSMALVLQPHALQHLQGRVPLPAVVQEFVNHGGQQWKVYVLGQKVFTTPRASIPDVYSNPDLPSEQQLLLFDSLASLPTQLPAQMTQPHSTDHKGESSQQPQQQPDQAAVEAIAAFLRSQLGLTLFGFDVVVASKPCVDSSSCCCSSQLASAAGFDSVQPAASNQELVVIDINYFPNYRGGSNTPALFRQAVVQCWQQHAAALQQRSAGACSRE